MRIALLFGVLAACYSPQAKPGAQCSAGGLCPEGLSCAADHTCEPPGYQVSDAPSIAADIAPDTTPACAVAVPSNDEPGGAIDVTAGGDFMADLTCAEDNAAPGNNIACGTDGGRDVYFKVSVTSDQIFYFDTFGSDFNTVIRVYPGACKNGYVAGAICHNDQCNSQQTQWVGKVLTGDNCVVVDQYDAEPNSQLKLHVEPGYWNGAAVAAGVAKTTSGTTAGLNDDSAPSCAGPGGPDHAYYIVGCPGSTLTLDATTCSTATVFDSVVYVLGPGQTELACNDDDVACAAMPTASTLSGVQLAGAHLFWLIVDSGAATDSGAYTLTTTLQ